VLYGCGPRAFAMRFEVVEERQDSSK